MSSTIAASQNKLNDLLEAIRQEFASVSQEANSYRLQNQKDYDYKINQHLAEMQQIRNTVYELELSHRKMKDTYQEEINRLKVELSQRDHQIASMSQQQQQVQQQIQQQVQSGQPQVLAIGAAPQQEQPSAAAAAASVGQTPPIIPQGNGPTLNPLISALGNQLKGPVATPPAQEDEKKIASLPPTVQTKSPKVPSAQTAATKKAHPEAEPQSQAQSAAATEDNQAPAATSAATKQDNVATQDATANAQFSGNENDLVHYDQRASQMKPIPPFLLDLDYKQVPENLRKKTEEYDVLYNPALPRTLEVELHKSLEHTSVVCCVKFSNDGQYLATGCNKTTQVFRVSDGELVARLSDDNAPSIQNGGNGSDSGSTDLYIRSVCFSPDGKFLATGAEDRLIRIWDLAQQKIVMVLQGHDQDVYSLDYFPSGDKLVSGSGDRTVRIWDLKTGQCSLTLSIEDGVTTVAVSPGDGKYIAAGSLDRAVRVWDSETGFLVERLDSENELGTGHRDSVYSVVFTRDGNKVVSSSLDRSVKLWNLRGYNEKENAADNNKSQSSVVCEVTYIGHKDFVLSVTTTANDEFVLSGSKDRGVLFWDTNTGNPLLMLQGHRNSVISVAVANGHPLGPEYQVFATGSGDCRARIWKFSKLDSASKVKEIQG
ncbi:chromatin-silencing transcriptional regulator TUP1 KNAG_0D00250 [Huiozyma naganishii CBS 8797]|uniref:General transcriptional corepressor TUP1 n=1 Tax=Huiozyma naganishii (strain ATCC MYA-139 / BCRC 22969 / CBS 8797 / KCTC 17520 / NBRC 10181 / NCYC 3082 / Yp74L-3) TaxID=1071383 RepID=J7RJU3_HUIN7|nr:hypothetical protein KNAG_0D00250 [Kazachstania naganishii CBS 8797]CCK69778.1 hypothetical protein KNAG_0D00250 [Kazachstania naganishii CBS 8797]